MRKRRIPSARPPRPGRPRPQRAAHRATRSRPSHYTFTTLPLRQPPQTEPDHRHYSDRSGAPPVTFHNKMFIFNNCRQISGPRAARGAFKFSRCISVWKLPLWYPTIRFNSKYVSLVHYNFDFVNTAYEVILTIYLHAEMLWNQLVISCKMHFRIARLQLHSLSFRFHSNTIEQSSLMHLQPNLVWL